MGRRYRSRATVSRSALLATTILALMAGAGCRGTSAPTLPPGGFQEIFAELARRGATVGDPVSGASGCDDPALAANAIRVELTTPGDPSPRPIHLFIFKDDAAFGAAEGQVRACERTYGARQGTERVTHLDVSPYRAFGTGLSDATTELVREALAEAAHPRGLAPPAPAPASP